MTRPRIGTIVRAPETKIWRGRVLFVVPESDGDFMTNVAAGTMRGRVVFEERDVPGETFP